MTPRCTGRRADGKPCQGWRVAGSDKCRRHLPNPQARARAAVRAEVIAWGLGSADIDPGEVLLRLVSQSSARAEHYARLLEEQYRHAAEGTTNTDLPGGIRALIGYRYALDRDGGKVAVEEAIRGLVVLEAEERDRCAHFAAKAVAAGLAERQVRLAERHGALIADVLRAVLGDPELGLNEEQRRAVPDIARRHLALVS